MIYIWPARPVFFRKFATNYFNILPFNTDYQWLLI